MASTSKQAFQDLQAARRQREQKTQAAAKAPQPMQGLVKQLIQKKQQERKESNWDIDNYRTDYESEEHWALRRRFMEVHRDKFDEERLVCLAQCFVNIEFMGCKYPDDVMLMVGQLSQEVAKEFRAERALKLKRTFVTASDAAEARAKGRRSTQQQQQQKQESMQGARGNSSNSNTFGKQRKRFGTGEWEQQSQQQGHGPPPAKQHCGIFEGCEFGKFVLFLQGGRNCIRVSAQRCSLEFQEKELSRPDSKKLIEIYLNGKKVTSASEESTKVSKATAFNNALDILQKNCYSIKPNPLRDTIRIEKSNNQVVCGVTRQQSDTLDDKKLDANNKGYKMMKMMGWTGGGLGSKTQGREDPVGYLLKNNRAGLGNEACKLDRSYFTQMLKNYIGSEDIRELKFESTFTKDERAMLHEIAGKINLKSTSHGKGDDRCLIICKKNISSEKILTEVLLNKNTSYCDQYFVQVPAFKAHLYPEHTATLELDS